MDEYTETRINEIGGKIDTINSIFRALLSSICGTEELTHKDTCNFAYLMEEKLQNLTKTHNELIDKLGI